MKNLSLTTHEYDTFAENGWIGPFDSGATEELLLRCRDKSERIVSEKIANPMFKRYSVRDWHLVDEDFLTLFKRDEIVARVQSILGHGLKLWRSKIFRTPAGGGGVGWHQEWGYFNGEEIGNDMPALKPLTFDDKWNISVWVALDDIAIERSPMVFLNGSHKTRHEIKMVSITESAFFEDPFLSAESKQAIIEKVNHSQLLLDIDTTKLLDGVDCEALSLSELKSVCLQRLQSIKAAVTLPFDADGRDKTVTMKKGQFVIFSERCMHRSLPNRTPFSRVAVNCRITPTSTEVYPSRSQGHFTDGSNLDISGHYCVPLD